ncbi:TonB-dependent siderophore receptor [Stutzerimonas kirkiae]|uniref:TonB-dependent siderophore receptor n=2 Tax=Stutzerimonas kirkiae TaxID=2211392 RepID=A0A4Q9QY32_9GAMM|nr:TonB-dependent siderophore receptor [Stutzerimonas kirkiae]TBU98211.1 TonB-dependent siderophore receptor [Stutzerimonas kirkiae]
MGDSHAGSASAHIPGALTMKRQPAHPAFTLLAISSFLPALAMAQPSGDDAGVLSVVTVTANKVEQDLQDVPQSVTVIDAATLEEKGISSIDDVIAEIPNMASNTWQGTSVNIRGLNTSKFTNNNPVVIYIDGVPHSSRFGFDASLANVERVEVLRGPQGTLYGKDAVGGIINVVTRKPGKAWRGKAGLEYGEDDTHAIVFDGSGALIDGSLYLGVNGQFSGTDGWIENVHPGMRKDAAEKRERKLNTYLLYEPNERFRARLGLSEEKKTAHFYEMAVGPGGSSISSFSLDKARKARFDTDTKEVADSNAQSLALTWKLAGVSLDAVTTHKKFELDGVYDSDFGVRPDYAGLTQFNNHATETWTQELRLSGGESAGPRWVAGLYLEKEEHAQGPYGQKFPGYDPATATYLGNFEMNADSLTDTRTQALFGQLIWPFAGSFELTLGGRWQRIEKEFDMDLFYLPVGVSGPAIYSLRDKTRWNAFLPKVALSHSLSPNWTAYASYAKGYMPGGYNYFASGGGADSNSFEPQTSANYEIGVKGRLDNLALAASLFYMDIEDIHVYKFDGIVNTTDNARKAHSQGAELELSWYPRDSRWEFSGALGLIEAKYDDYDTGTTRYDGERIENSPSHTLRLGVAYRHPGGAYARLDARNQGQVWFFDNASSDFVRYGSYSVFDFKTGYRLDNWELYGYVHNLTDRGYIQGFESSASSTLVSFGTPRRFGVGVRYEF